MNPSKFFWNSVGLCAVILTLFFCVAIYKSKLQILDSKIEFKLWSPTTNESN